MGLSQIIVALFVIAVEGNTNPVVRVGAGAPALG